MTLLVGWRRWAVALAVASVIGLGVSPVTGVAQKALAAVPKTQTFFSQPSLHPPVVTLSGTDPDPQAGDVFAGVQNSIQAGPMIIDPQGQLVWFKAMRRSAALNVELQRYKGRSVLTYWQGRVIQPGFGDGVDLVLDHSYRTVATVRAGHGYRADLHEFQITSRGTALITAYGRVSANLSSLGGPRKGSVLDSIIQEIDIATGRVVWEWHAYGHVPLAHSCAPRVRVPFDFFHINSIQQLRGGKVLVSSRHTCAVYAIEKRTGRILWTLGGKSSSFKMGPGTSLRFQHDARMQPDGSITVFDNAGDLGAPAGRYSRALRIRLNYESKRATLVHAYRNDPPVLSPNEGSTQVLKDGNTFVSWGDEGPYYTEFGALPGAQQLFSLSFPKPVYSYRAYRFAWWGQPATRPSIAVSSSTIYASWNGATDVASWRGLAGPVPQALVPVGDFPKTSFETAMTVASRGPYFAVNALDGAGHVLATSATVRR